MQQLMIDIETLSQQENAAILSIGAVFFDTTDYSLGETFYTNINCQTDPHFYGHISPETISWWMQQDDICRQQVFNNNPAPSLKVALENLAHYIRRESENKNLMIWSKSPNFDLSILKNALSRVNIQCPWVFRNERDVRTAIQLANDFYNADLNCIANPNTKHNALDDAKHQAAQIIMLYETAHQQKYQEAA